jgi:Chaperone of endosialidase
VLGFNPSTRRVKRDIEPMDKASETLYALKPVTFKYNGDRKGITQFGLVAEEVAEVNADLVLRDKSGQAETVRYEQINAMLLNEFLKEHNAALEERRKVEKLEGTVAGLVATVKERAAQIQKVSARLELNKPTPQEVANNH